MLSGEGVVFRKRGGFTLYWKKGEDSIRLERNSSGSEKLPGGDNRVSLEWSRPLFLGDGRRVVQQEVALREHREHRLPLRVPVPLTAQLQPTTATS